MSPLNGPNSKTTCQNPTNTGTFLIENEKSFRTSPNLTCLGDPVGWKSRFKVEKFLKKFRLILLIFEKKVSLKGLNNELENLESAVNSSNVLYVRFLD